MEEQNLRNIYPLSYRWIALRLVPLLLGTLVIGILVDYLFFQFWPELFEIVILCCVTFLLLRALYLFFYFLCLRYSLIDDEFYIVRGVVFKKPIGIPIKKINAIHIERSPMEILFGLATVVFVVPGEVPRKLLTLSGLSKSRAQSLKSFIFSKN